MINKRFTPVSRCAFAAVVAIVLLTVMAACARMGQPDGGWYDETPPRILSATPADKSVNVSSKKIYINFDEYIQIENAQEKVIVSPPQMEQPDIKSQGKRIVVQLRDMAGGKADLVAVGGVARRGGLRELALRELA